jgi:hypothetical protein
MGKLLPGFRKALLDEIQSGITTNTAHYYAFAGSYVPNSAWAAISSYALPQTADDYSAVFSSDWKMLFGKKIEANTVFSMATRYDWAANTVYQFYDDRLDLSNSNFYVVTSPVSGSGYFQVYKCIDAPANGAASTIQPDLVQSLSFTKSDGYTWRYITSIDYVTFGKYATTKYFPITSNTTTQAAANSYTGIEKVIVTQSGSGYQTYHTGTISSVPDPYTIQISSNAASIDNFYTNNSIYIYDNGTAQLKNITAYRSTLGVGNFITVDTAVNTQQITAGSTSYRISPQVYFDTDATSKPKAYTTINAVSNSILGVVIVEPGAGANWANAKIISNTAYGSGASLRAIAPPPGGHASNPTTELQAEGIGFSFTFANTETNKIPVNVSYNKIGIIRNPKLLLQNGTGSANNTGYLGTNAFSQVLMGNITPTGVVFTVGDNVKGANSKASGQVVFSNSTVLYLTGDKYFSNNETVVSSDGTKSTALTINTYGDIFVDDVYPLYVQNIDNVTRSNTQSETFKLIIQV